MKSFSQIDAPPSAKGKKKNDQSYTSLKLIMVRRDVTLRCKTVSTQLNMKTTPPRISRYYAVAHAGSDAQGATRSSRLTVSVDAEGRNDAIGGFSMFRMSYESL